MPLRGVPGVSLLLLGELSHTNSKKAFGNFPKALVFSGRDGAI